MHEIEMSDQEYLAEIVRGPRDYRIDFENRTEEANWRTIQENEGGIQDPLRICKRNTCAPNTIFYI